MRYPITPEDIQQGHDRQVSGEMTWIPVRMDVKLTDGRNLENVLTWGSPLAWEYFKGEDGLTYTRVRWD